MATDKYGYTKLSLTIIDSSNKKKDIPLISYHYEENDSYTFIRHDDMKEIFVEIDRIVDENLIKFILNKMNLTKDIRFALTKMLNENNICSGSFFVGEYK